MNFALESMNCALESMNLALKTINMMTFVVNDDELCIKNDELGTSNGLRWQLRKPRDCTLSLCWCDFFQDFLNKIRAVFNRLSSNFGLISTDFHPISG